MIEKNNTDLSVVRQSELLCIHRSGIYYTPCQESPFNLDLMKVIDEQFLDMPFYGVSRMTEHLKSMGYLVNIKRIRRLYRLMDLRAIFPAPKTTWANKKHKKYPYLLRDLVINRPNQVWACDITYIPMRHGFMYLVAIIDLYSRFVVSWGIVIRYNFLGTNSFHSQTLRHNSKILKYQFIKIFIQLVLFNKWRNIC